MQITPDILNDNLNPHRIEELKANGKYYKAIGQVIKGENIKQEVNELLAMMKRPFEE